MSFFHRAWVAASVAVVQGHPDQRQIQNTSLRSIQQGKRLFSGERAADIRPLYGALDADLDGVIGNCDGDERRRQTDESLQRVMYLNCWGQG